MTDRSEPASPMGEPTSSVDASTGSDRSTAGPTATGAATPRLTRSRSDRMIAGVAGGIARHLGIDPALVRLAFVLLALVNGIGIIAYVVLWFLLPEDDGEQAPATAPARDTRTLIGWGLVAIGAWMLLERLVPAFGRIAFPLLLIVGGVAILVSATRR